MSLDPNNIPKKFLDAILGDLRNAGPGREPMNLPGGRLVRIRYAPGSRRVLLHNGETTLWGHELPFRPVLRVLRFRPNSELALPSKSIFPVSQPCSPE